MQETPVHSSTNENGAIVQQRARRDRLRVGHGLSVGETVKDISLGSAVGGSGAPVPQLWSTLTGIDKGLGRRRGTSKVQMLSTRDGAKARN